MDLTPKGFTKSEVTENKELVKVGTMLTYSDICNYYQRFEVIEVTGNLAALKDTETGFELFIDLDALQIGWRFATTNDPAPALAEYQHITSVSHDLGVPGGASPLGKRQWANRPEANY